MCAIAVSCVSGQSAERTMSTHTEYDPDDNFARSFSADADIDEEAALEAVAWQLLLLINPGDEDAAMQQFQACRDSLDEGEDPVELIRDVIDWKSGFHVEAGDAAGLVQCIDELSARFGLRIDWGVEDPTDAAFLAAADVPTLIGRAHEQLREHGYTLWTWSMNEAPREDVFAGWITLRSDDESMEIIAPALGIALRPGSAF
jgi:hypothetical protein